MKYFAMILGMILTAIVLAGSILAFAWNCIQ